MSRRLVELFEPELICSDRGRHKPYRLGMILQGTSGRSPSGPGASMVRDETGWGTKHRLTCGGSLPNGRRCPRDVQLAEATWAKLVQWADDTHVRQIDISYLPF